MTLDVLKAAARDLAFRNKATIENKAVMRISGQETSVLAFMCGGLYGLISATGCIRCFHKVSSAPKRFGQRQAVLSVCGAR